MTDDLLFGFNAKFTLTVTKDLKVVSDGVEYQKSYIKNIVRGIETAKAGSNSMCCALLKNKVGFEWCSVLLLGI